MWKVREEPLQSRKGRISPGIYTEVDGQLVTGIVLPEGRSQAFVEMRLEALDRANDSDMGGLGGIRRGKGPVRRTRVVFPSGGTGSALAHINKSNPAHHITSPGQENGNPTPETYNWKYPRAQTATTAKYQIKPTHPSARSHAGAPPWPPSTARPTSRELEFGLSFSMGGHGDGRTKLRKRTRSAKRAS